MIIYFMDLIFGERRISLMNRFTSAMKKAEASNDYKRSIAELVEEIGVEVEDTPKGARWELADKKS